MVAPFNWTDAIVERLCTEIASGRSIREVSAEAWCPSEPTIYRRMAADPAFDEIIGKARAAQQDYEADACVHMADAATPEDWQVVKLRIWARQWRASKLASRRYGDKLALGGAADLPPIQSNVTIDAAEAYKTLLGGGNG